MDLLVVFVVAAATGIVVLAAVAVAAVVAVDSTVMHCNYSNGGADCMPPWKYFLCYEI